MISPPHGTFDISAPHPDGVSVAWPPGPTADSSALRVRCSTASAAAAGAANDGGDFAESFSLPDRSVVLGVWDASDNAETAAADTMVLRAGLRAVLSVNSDVVATVGALNRVLSRRADDAVRSPRVTGFFGLVNRADRNLHYVSCGHDTAILFRTTGEHVHLTHNSPPLGTHEASTFSKETVRLESGDALAIVTSGVTKARPAHSEVDFFGTSRLCSLLHSRQREDAADATWLMSHVLTFSDGFLAADAAVLIARFT